MAKAIITHTVPCYDAKTMTGYDHDPDKARAFLAQSKYGSGANLGPMPTASRVPGWISALEVLQEVWKDELGAEITLTRIEAGQRYPEYLNPRRFSAGSYFADASGLIIWMGKSDGAMMKQQVHGGSPELDAMIDEANSLALDDPRRCQLYQAANKEIMDQYYVLPVISTMNPVWLVQDWVKGFEPFPNSWFGSLPYIVVEAH